MLAGVDIGGTFTDFVISKNGRLSLHKRLSTPHNPAEAMVAGLTALDSLAAQVVCHGTTVATNAILERKGARAALLTTAGFRDLLVIGRQNRPDLYALAPSLAPPLIPRERCYEVHERLDASGEIITPLDEGRLDGVIAQMKAAGVESIAVCLLFSFLNPVHEEAIRARLIEVGGFEAWQISLSCEVLPQFREYERASTVALDASVRPIIAQYLHALESRIPAPLRIMKSDGGLVSASRAAQEAVQTALSGPAAGVIGAFHLAKLAGYDRIITLDMGGTSTDVALCPAKIPRRSGAEIDGLPLHLPVVDIETVGAGGGSLAHVDSGGALRVGPDSAGANPGPIIYGRDGEGVTVSDANAVLGRLNPAHFLGGEITLQLEPAQLALDQLAAQMGLNREAAALGILAVANSNIERAVRRVSVARGHDPREFTLVAFGGAGPLHACDVAVRLGIRRVLIPRYPGVLCALGLLLADVSRDYRRAVLRPWSDALYVELTQFAATMTAQAQADFPEEQALKLTFELDMRYRGQSFELSIPLSDSSDAAFHTAHEAAYGHAFRDRPLEVVNLRLAAVLETEKPVFTPEIITPNDGASALVGNGDLPTYERERLMAGASFKGPALIFQLDSTIYIPVGWSARVDAYHNVILENDSGDGYANQ